MMGSGAVGGCWWTSACCTGRNEAVTSSDGTQTNHQIQRRRNRGRGKIAKKVKKIAGNTPPLTWAIHARAPSGAGRCRHAVAIPGTGGNIKIAAVARNQAPIRATKSFGRRKATTNAMTSVNRSVPISSEINANETRFGDAVPGSWKAQSGDSRAQRPGGAVVPLQRSWPPCPS